MAVAQLKSAPPPRSPEREALAEAIQRRDLASRLLAANEAAQKTAEAAAYDARRAVERATAAIEKAKADAAHHLTDLAMGEAGEAPMTVKDARTKLQDAEDELDAAVSAKERLKAQHEAAANELRWAVDARDKAVRAVLRDEARDILDKTLKEAAALQEQLGAKRVVLSFLGSECFGWGERELAKPIADFLAAPAYPLEFNHRRDEHPALEPWHAAREALRQNADAPLPL